MGNEDPNDPSREVQGEGDYESARRFNETEREFVKRHGSPRQSKVDSNEERELEAAEERAGARGKEREHDATDEEIFRDEMIDDDEGTGEEDEEE